MTLDDWLDYRHITEDNVDEFIERNRHTWWGMGSMEINFGISPKGLTLNNSWDEDYQTYSWEELRKYVKQPKQIKWF